MWCHSYAIRWPTEDKEDQVKESSLLRQQLRLAGPSARTVTFPPTCITGEDKTPRLLSSESMTALVTFSLSLNRCSSVLDKWPFAVMRLSSLMSKGRSSVTLFYQHKTTLSLLFYLVLFSSKSKTCYLLRSLKGVLYSTVHIIVTANLKINTGQLCRLFLVVNNIFSTVLCEYISRPPWSLKQILLRSHCTWPMSHANHLPLLQSQLTPQCSHHNPPSACTVRSIRQSQKKQSRI